MNKNQSRLRRAKRTRMNFKFQSLPRLTVFKSSKHLYAQVIEPDGNKVITSASSHDKSISEKTSNLKTVEKIGQLIAERALENGIKKVVFDRSGYLYHGKIKMIAESARSSGLEI